LAFKPVRIGHLLDFLSVEGTRCADQATWAEFEFLIFSFDRACGLFPFARNFFPPSFPDPSGLAFFVSHFPLFLSVLSSMLVAPPRREKANGIGLKFALRRNPPFLFLRFSPSAFP